jgi:DNA uptake protein ComE-like DNA-binding protein
MKKLLVMIWVFKAFLLPTNTQAQQVGSSTEQQLENLSEVMEGETEDDNYLQLLTYYLKHPLNLNRATEEDLQAFKMLTPLQIQKLIAYRKQLGNLVDLYELQAVPLWDLETIRKLLSYVSVQPGINNQLLSRLRQGDHIFMGRYARVLEKQKGYNNNLSNSYAGNPDRLLFRYKYQYTNLLQYGIVADKDAGEPLFRSGAKGFDFYSFHLFARQLGVVKSLAIGGFTVNMGQGLIQWQSLALKKVRKPFLLYGNRRY